MAEKTTRIVIRQGTAAQWASENPILAAGEPGYATDSKIVKFGDGSSRWLDLTGIQANPSSPREGAYIPALSFGADSTGVTYASRAGRYTLLGGDQVSFSLNLQLSAKGSATGDMRITLPFGAYSNVKAVFPAGVAGITPPANTIGYVAVIEGGVLTVRANTSTGAMVPLTEAHIGDASEIFVTGTYQSILGSVMAAQNLADLPLTQDLAMNPVDVSVDFVGQNLRFILAPGSAPLPDGLALSLAGIISGTPRSAINSRAMVVRGINDQEAFADSAFSITVAKAITVDNQLADLTLRRRVAMTPENLASDFTDNTGGGLTYALSPDSDPLPAGLTLSSAGSLEGAPTVEATNLNIVVRARNSAGTTADSAFQMSALPSITAAGNIAAQALIQRVAMMATSVATAFTDHSGGGLTFTLAPGSAQLPQGVNMSTAGVLSGTPTAAASARTITVRGRNTFGDTLDRTFSISVTAAITAAGGLSDVTVNQGAAMTAVNVSADFTDHAGLGVTYALAPGSAALPAGLTLTSGGVLSGTATESVGNRTIVVRGSNPAGDHADSAFVITSLAGVVQTATIPNQPSLVEDVAMAPLDLDNYFTTTAPGAISYALAPNSATLPAGLVLSSVGVLSGTPTQIVSGRTIIVRATNSAGRSVDASFTVTVSPGVIAAGALDDLTLTAGTAMANAFVNADFTDNTGLGLTYALAPASAALPAGITLLGSGVLSGTPSATASLRTIVIRARDPNDNFADSAFQMIVQAAANRAPTVTNDSASVAEDGTITVSPLANDSDQDGDPLTIQSITQPTHGVAVITGANTQVQYIPDANYFGADSLTYVASDGRGGTTTGTITFAVTAVNDAPVAADDAVTTPADTPVTIGVLSNDTDVEGNTLTVISATVASGIGAAVINGDNTVTVTPGSGYAGQIVVNVTISDGQGGTDTSQLVVTVQPAANQAPTASNDTVSTPANTGLTFDPRSNDTDPDGDPITITAITQPANGSATITGGGTTITFTPATDYTGATSMTYTISDGQGNTDTGTISITVTAAATPGAETVTYRSTTFNFTNALGQGTYEDGSPWVRRQATGTQLTSTVPASAYLSNRTFAGGGNVAAGDAHGLVIDPGNAARYNAGNMATLAARQQANIGSLATQTHGYDSYKGKTVQPSYDPAANVDPGKTGSALALNSDMTLVKATSKTTNVPSSAELGLDRLVPLHVVALPPAAGDFAPPVCSADKTPRLNVSEIQWGRLLNLAAPAGGVIPPASEILELLDFCLTFEHLYGPNGENIIAPNPARMDTSGDFFKVATYYGTTWQGLAHIALALNTNAWTPTEKQAIVKKMVPFAINLAGRIHEGGIIHDNGGWAGGGWIIAWLIGLTGNAWLQSALDITVQATFVANGKYFRAGEKVYGDARQHRTVLQADINAALDVTGNSGVSQVYNFTQAQLGWPEWGGDATRSAASTGVGIVRNSLGPMDDHPEAYRHIKAKSDIPWALVANLLPQMRTAVEGLNVQMLYYADRYMGWWGQADILVDGIYTDWTNVTYTTTGSVNYITRQETNTVRQWVLDLWAAHRGDAYRWTPSGVLPGVAAPTVLTIAEPAGPIYGTNMTTGLATIRLSGTHDQDGATLQYRLVNAANSAQVVGWTDFTAGAGGVWQIDITRPPSKTELRAEVRAKSDTNVSDAQAGGWFAGRVLGWMGQSLISRPTTHVTPNPTFVPPTKRLAILYNDANGVGLNPDVLLADGPQWVGSSSPIALRRMAAVIEAYGDAPVLIVDLSQAGTGQDEMAQDSLPGRSWATTMQQPVDYVRNTLRTDVDLVIEHWFTNVANVASTPAHYPRHWAPLYLRRMIDGIATAPDASGITNYTGGQVQVSPYNQYTPDHFLFDLTGAGGGLFNAARTKWFPMFGAAHWSYAAHADGEIAANDQFKANVRAAVEDMATNQAAYEPITLSSLPGYSGQEAFGGHAAMPGGTHVKSGDIDGESLVGAYLMTAVMRALGLLSRDEPRVIGATWASSGAYVDVQISLPHGGNLSTAFIEQAAGAYAGSLEGSNWVAPTGTPAGLADLHEVQGFSILRAGGGRQFTNFTAVIQNAAAGIVRITPTVAFQNGDAIAFGFGDGVHMLTTSNLEAGRPHTRWPLETRAHVSGTGYGYMVVRESGTAALFTASGIGAANTAPVANNDSVTTAQDTAITFNPRSNDTDANGDPLTITAITQPANGSATITGGGTTITFTPAASWNGATSMTYTISDGNGGTATGTISITVTAAASAPRVQKAEGSNATIGGTTIPAATNGITVRFVGQFLPYSSSTAFQDLYHWASTTNVAQMDARSGQQAFRAYAEDSTGAGALNGYATSASGVLPLSSDVDFVSSVGLGVSGNNEYRGYINGSLVLSKTTATGSSQTFSTNRALTLFGGGCGLIIERVEIYYQYVPSGDVSALTPDIVLAGNADYWNEVVAGLPAGFGKGGTALFTNV